MSKKPMKYCYWLSNGKQGFCNNRKKMRKIIDHHTACNRSIIVYKLKGEHGRRKADKTGGKTSVVAVRSGPQVVRDAGSLPIFNNVGAIPVQYLGIKIPDKAEIADLTRGVRRRGVITEAQAEGLI